MTESAHVTKWELRDEGTANEMVCAECLCGWSWSMPVVLVVSSERAMELAERVAWVHRMARST